ncbi:MAG: crotonase/enoyl-CoA hydratase family protein [Gammaproteobacteria bacterium]
MISSTTFPVQSPVCGVGEQIRTDYDAERRIYWVCLKPAPRPCFTPILLHECREVHADLVRHASLGGEAIEFMVVCSDIPGVFNLGGDLHLFLNLIERADRNGLLAYAKACIDLVYQQSVHLHLPLTTIALVQGDALGGGFEAALSCNVIIAEKQAQFGLPEILFNLIPGMGAYNFLAQRIGPVRAEQMILSGKIYSADELFEMGIVDVIAEPGAGVTALQAYTDRAAKYRNGYQAIQRVRSRLNPIRHDELMAVGNIWVDAALALTPKDLKVIQRLIRAQDRRFSANPIADEVSPSLYAEA